MADFSRGLSLAGEVLRVPEPYRTRGSRLGGALFVEIEVGGWEPQQVTVPDEQTDLWRNVNEGDYVRVSVKPRLYQGRLSWDALPLPRLEHVPPTLASVPVKAQG